MSKKIEIVGIDPAFKNWGMAKCLLDVSTLDFEVIDLKLIETEKSKIKSVKVSSDKLARSIKLFRGFQDFTKNASFIIAEIPSGAQSANAASALGIALGVLSSAPCPIIQVSPTDVKMNSVGRKTASKEDIINWARKNYPHAPWDMTKKRDEHLSDAVAAVHAGLVTDELDAALAIMRSMAA